MLDFNQTFIHFRFFIAIVFTILPFLWLRRIKSKLEQFYFIFIVLLIFVYSGVGVGWEDTPMDYLVKYIIYIAIFGFTSFLVVTGRKKYEHKDITKVENHGYQIGIFIKRYGSFFVFMYVILPLVGLVVGGNLGNLISPPELNLTEVVESKYDERGAMESLIYYIGNLLLPFYYVCLYKYKDNIPKLALALLLPIYFNYASTGYVARSTILPQIIIIYFAIYLKYTAYRKKILVSTIIGLPFLLFVLSLFTFLRIGRDFNLSFDDAIFLLVWQETSYPTHYLEMRKWPFDDSLFYTYIDWLVKLPFPGFLKNSDLDYAFTSIFSEKILGIPRGGNSFYILLPGLVGEGIFIFGKYFYWFHAIIVGIIISGAYKLVHHKQELFLVLYMAIFCGLCFARAGTVSTYPFYFKHLILYIVVIYWYSRGSKSNNVYRKA